MSGKQREHWGSRLGVVLAVAGSAVGLGNFLRFPGQAAQNGAGAFMIPYFIALLIVGIPLAWAEWSMGRYAGVRGFHSAPGIFATLCRKRWAGFMGSLALLIPMMIYTYYIVIEAWCLGYAWHYLTGDLMVGSDPRGYSGFFNSFTGGAENGSALTTSISSVEIAAETKAGIDGATADATAITMSVTPLIYFVVPTFILNFILIYRGITKGIETFCKFAMPLMIVCALFVLFRVLTLGTPNPDLPAQSVSGGLGFMWNPDFTKLTDFKTWLAAAGQIFFSLSVGFGVIINYASYLRKKDDIALSGVTATATNEFFEVCLGGLITLPAAFIFLGVAAGSFGTFGLGFNALPNVFALMPGGRIFGFVWFFMLFLAAITSSLSMLQPVSAFLKEGLDLKRGGSTILLALITGTGACFVIYYSKNLSALDNIDFWCGTFLIVVLALIQSIIYGWVFGINRGQKELDSGALLRVPFFVSLMLKFVTPIFLAVILFGTIYNSGGDYVENLKEDPVARHALVLIGIALLMLLLMIGYALQRWQREGRFDDLENDVE